MAGKELNFRRAKYVRLTALGFGIITLLLCSSAAARDLTYERSRAIDKAAKDIFNPFVSNAQLAKEIQDIVRYTLPETTARELQSIATQTSVTAHEKRAQIVRVIGETKACSRCQTKYHVDSQSCPKCRLPLVNTKLPVLVYDLASGNPLTGITVTAFWKPHNVPHFRNIIAMWYGAADHATEVTDNTGLAALGVPPVPLRYVQIDGRSKGYPAHSIVVQDLDRSPIFCGAPIVPTGNYVVERSYRALSKSFGQDKYREKTPVSLFYWKVVDSKTGRSLIADMFIDDGQKFNVGVPCIYLTQGRHKLKVEAPNYHFLEVWFSNSGQYDHKNPYIARLDPVSEFSTKYDRLNVSIVNYRRDAQGVIKSIGVSVVNGSTKPVTLDKGFTILVDFLDGSGKRVGSHSVSPFIGWNNTLPPGGGTHEWSHVDYRVREAGARSAKFVRFVPSPVGFTAEKVSSQIESEGNVTVVHDYTRDEEETPRKRTFHDSAYDWSRRHSNLGCFIATAAYGTPLSNKVKTLCQFRDTYMVRSHIGRALVSLYYKCSPPIAKAVSGSRPLRSVVRCALWPVVLTASIFLFSPVAGWAFMALYLVGIALTLKAIKAYYLRRKTVLAGRMEKNCSTSRKT